MALPENKYLQSDYAQRKLAEARARAAQPMLAVRLRGKELRVGILAAIDSGRVTHTAIAQAAGYEDEDNPFCEAIAAMIAGGLITFSHTGREVYSHGARGMVEERIYRKLK